MRIGGFVTASRTDYSLSAALTARMQFPELEHLLRGTFVFSRLPARELARLEHAFTLHVFQAGETIVKRGQPAHGWHIVSSGRVRVLEQTDAASAAPLILDKGDTFGD